MALVETEINYPVNEKKIDDGLDGWNNPSDKQHELRFKLAIKQRLMIGSTIILMTNLLYAEIIAFAPVFVDASNIAANGGREMTQSPVPK